MFAIRVADKGKSLQLRASPEANRANVKSSVIHDGDAPVSGGLCRNNQEQASRKPNRAGAEYSKLSAAITTMHFYRQIPSRILPDHFSKVLKEQLMDEEYEKAEDTFGKIDDYALSLKDEDPGDDVGSIRSVKETINPDMPPSELRISYTPQYTVDQSFRRPPLDSRLVDKIKTLAVKTDLRVRQIHKIIGLKVISYDRVSEIVQRVRAENAPSV